MPQRDPTVSEPQPVELRLLVAFAALAVAAGVFARFKGLGTWPFGVDEYYFGRSVQNILQFGVPAFECGGYYIRGILLQYVAAGLQLLGLSPELAPRAISAICSLAALPAAFLLGKRMQGVTLGLLAVALLAISVWQIEMGRFGRFYAPFQAVFLWYLVFFLWYTIDRRLAGLVGMVAFSLLGILVWEGGVLLAVANLLPPFLNHDRGRLTGAQWRYLVLMLLFLFGLYWLVNIDFRQALDGRPPDYYEVIAAARDSTVAGPGRLVATIAAHPAWLLPGLLLLALAAWASRWILGFRHRWLTAAGLFAALAAALLHLFLLTAAILVLLLLVRLLDWRELFDRRALPYLAALVSAGVFWVAFGLVTTLWRGDAPMSSMGAITAVAFQLVGDPDIVNMVARPWAGAIPLLGLGIFVLLGISIGRAALGHREVSPTERALLVIAIIMLILVGAADAPRIETRYSFFLYPVLLIVAIGILFRAAHHFAAPLGRPALVAAAVVLAWFALTEDVQPRHLAKIDSPEINFRVGMKPRVGSHYYGRGDIRAVADWLQAHAEPPGDLVISGPGIASLDFYYRNLDFVYVDPSDQRLGAWSCRRGTIERWTSLPLVYSREELLARIAGSPRTFLVLDSRLVAEFQPLLAHLQPTLVWENPHGHHSIMVFEHGEATAP
jgi:hypothetical protein